MTAKNLFWLLLLALLAAGCPKRLPEAEWQAAEQATAGLDETQPCAPETTQAARSMMENARALIKEERYEEAKTALLAAQRLAEKARRECDEKRAAEEAARRAAPPQPPSPQPAERPAELEPGKMETVYFGFNEAVLTDEAREILARNAEFLRRKPEARVQIEGHCDERGSTEYNLALGERRAMSVRDYLVKLGVEPRRMEVISYGEERPADPRPLDLAWARNRRAEFRELR